jgi:hypothetical protein
MSHAHATIREAPAERFSKEKEHRLELPKDRRIGESERYVDFHEESRKITNDCPITYGGKRYSVPYLCTG